MPIIIKDFKWKESLSMITINVPIKDIYASKADIFTCKTYIKLSFKNYFFELFLLHEIDPQNSSCIVAQDEVIFHLKKVEEIIWGAIELNISKSEKNELKKILINEAHQKIQKENEERENQKHELKRVSVREQISLDTKQREMIEKIKNEEKEKEMEDFQEWRSGVHITELSSESSESSDDEDVIQKEEIKSTTKPKSKINYKQIKNNIIVQDNKNVAVPLPRKQSVLSVNFTDRQFPTPCRESRLEEEEKWLEKQVQVQRSVGFVSKDLRHEERNPLYLKSKGDQFMKAKNYLAAISAYTFGIKLSENFSDLYIGRSEAHFLLENYNKCVRDCSAALDLMKPAVSANFFQRLICIKRRGEALTKLGMFKEGIGELQAALDMQPDNDEIRMKIERATIEFKKRMNNVNENVEETKVMKNDGFEALFNEKPTAIS